MQKGFTLTFWNIFVTRQDKLFILITAPPLSDPTYADNARAFNHWLVNDWLKTYPYNNVFVFDFYNVLTTNGGNRNTNDLGQETGNHHRWWNNTIQHKTDGGSNVSAYPSSYSDDHPSLAGNLKATGEFASLLNIAYHHWKETHPAKSFYVAKTGNDSNPGSEAQPWLTIQKAAKTLVAGETVYIKSGIYNERVEPQNSGSVANYITYAAYPGDTVTIDGTGVDLPEWTGLFDITGKAYIKVSGLRVTNARVNPHNLGIQADTSSHVIIEKNYVYNTNDSGIGIWSSSDVTVDHNEVEKPCQAGWNESLTVGGTDGFEVKNNLVHDSPKEGICTKDGSSNGKVFGNEVHHTAAVGFYVDAQDKHTHDIEVYGNVSHHGVENGFALASEVGGLLENVKVYNNVAYDNGWTGLQVTACCVADHPMSNIQIVNNTFYDNGRGQWGGGVYIENPQAENVVIRNNICSQNLSFQIAVDPRHAQRRISRSTTT